LIKGFVFDLEWRGETDTAEYQLLLGKKLVKNKVISKLIEFSMKQLKWNSRNGFN